MYSLCGHVVINVANILYQSLRVCACVANDSNARDKSHLEGISCNFEYYSGKSRWEFSGLILCIKLLRCYRIITLTYTEMLVICMYCCIH